MNFVFKNLQKIIIIQILFNGKINKFISFYETGLNCHCDCLKRNQSQSVYDFFGAISN